MNPEAILPASILYGTLLLALTAYAILGGADFGAGIWEFNTSFRSHRRDRQLLREVIGPVWEANHVWLIFVLVILWSAMPRVFQHLCVVMWLPLLLGLAGIVCRGAAFIFRAYSPVENSVTRASTVLFGLASTAAPFFLGTVVGGMLTHQANDPQSSQNAWLNPLAIYSGFFGVAVCLYLCSVFLFREAGLRHERFLMEIWRSRAMLSGVWTGLLAMAGLAFISSEQPEMASRLIWGDSPLVLLSWAGGMFSMVAIYFRWPLAAVLASVLAVAAVLWGAGLAVSPATMIPEIPLDQLVAPPSVLWAMLVAIAGGMLLLLPSLAWLFWLFKSSSALDHEHLAHSSHP
jgi:cytochrome d ubiquinol oxidase subunit II